MNNLAQMLNQVKSNPMQFLMQNKLNVPQNIANDPNAIIQHLMNSGKISQSDYDNAVNMAKKLGYKG